MNWDLVHGDPVPDDLAALSGAARSLQETSAAAGDVAAFLHRVGGTLEPDVWRGDGAEAFSSILDDLPKQLRGLQHSYGTASSALSRYHGTLESLRTAAQVFAREAESQAAAARAAQRSAQDAQQAQANGDPAADPAPHEAAHQAARQRLREAIEQVDSVRHQRRAADAQAAKGLADAAHLAPRASWQERLADKARAFKAWTVERLRDLTELMDKATEYIGIAVLVLVAIVAVVALFTGAVPVFLGLLSLLGHLATATMAVSVGARLARMGLGDDTVNLRALAVDTVILLVTLGAASSLKHAAHGVAHRASHQLLHRSAQPLHHARWGTRAKHWVFHQRPNVYETLSRGQKAFRARAISEVPSTIGHATFEQSMDALFLEGGLARLPETARSALRITTLVGPPRVQVHLTCRPVPALFGGR